MYSKKGTLTAAVILMMAAALFAGCGNKEADAPQVSSPGTEMPGRQTKERALEETPPREAKPGTTERRILMITRIIRLIPERWGRAREMGPALKIRLAKARPIPRRQRPKRGYGRGLRSVQHRRFD